MAIDYLRLIQVFAEATGNRGLISAPAVTEKIFSLPIEEDNHHAHFVYDVALSRQVLRNADVFIQDHFLDQLLADCDNERVKWVKLFVEESPEFLDGTNHTVKRKMFKTTIDNFVSILSAKSSQEITSLAIHSIGVKNCSTLGLAKAIIRLRFRQILEELLATSVDLDDDLLFGPEIFTPSIRIRSSVYRLNESTDKFLHQYVDVKYHNDASFVLPILSLFYMASTPILASLAAYLNSKLCDMLADDSMFIDFKMIPTNYVAREASQDAILDGTFIHAGDKLYVMLFESTGCPFSGSHTMPFGYGKHLCPGAELSKLILRQTKEAIDVLPAELLTKLKASTIKKGKGSAFLVYQD
jgi:hypothetical protein